jgi:long-subunit acyl-CoA synthetase (AMP-forming)
VVASHISARLGSLCVPINYMLSVGEVAYILGHSEASAMVVEDQLLHWANTSKREPTAKAVGESVGSA